MKFFAPRYYPEFSCIADKCQHNCCQGWRITVSKAEYSRLRNLRSYKEIQTAMKRIRNEPTDRAYALMQLNDKEVCVCQEETGLCALQLHCGYENLPLTCRRFPRDPCIVGKRAEKSCTTACEQVINLLLQMPQGVDIIEVEEQTFATDTFIDHLTAIEDKAICAYYEQIQRLCLGILRNRDYSLPHRLILLGLLMRDLASLVNTEDTAEIERVLKQRQALLGYDETLDASFAQMPTNTSFCIANALTNLEKKLLFGGKDLHLTALKEDVLKVLDASFVPLNTTDCTMSWTFTEEAFAKARDKFDAFFEKESFIFENILVNFFFNFQYPLARGNVWENYMTLCSVYNLFRVMAIGYTSEHPSTQGLVHVLMLCSRAFFNDKIIRDITISQLCDTESNTLAHMAMLVKG